MKKKDEKKHEHTYGVKCELCVSSHPDKHKELTADEHFKKGQRRARRRRPNERKSS